MSVDPVARGLAALTVKAGLGGLGKTVTVSTPLLNLTQGWSGAGAFTALLFNLTSDSGPSAAGSLLMDLQVATVSKFSVSKAGVVVSASSIQSGGTVASSAGGGASIGADGSGKPQVVFGSGGSVLNYEAANTLALRNGVNAQAFRAYNTFTDLSNYERVALNWASNVATLTPENAGTGSARILVLVTGSTTVASLPAATAALAGARAFVTDANAATFGTTAAAGGANKVPVTCDGAAWKIG